MEKTVKIGGQEVTLRANAATPIHFKRIIGKNLFEMLTLGETETIMELAYVMHLQAEGEPDKGTPDRYVEWLEGFGPMDFVSGNTPTEITEVYASQAEPSSVVKKN